MLFYLAFAIKVSFVILHKSFNHFKFHGFNEGVNQLMNIILQPEVLGK